MKYIWMYVMTIIANLFGLIDPLNIKDPQENLRMEIVTNCPKAPDSYIRLLFCVVACQHYRCIDNEGWCAKHEGGMEKLCVELLER